MALEAERRGALGRQLSALPLPQQERPPDLQERARVRRLAPLQRALGDGDLRLGALEIAARQIDCLLYTSDAADE